MAEAIKKGIRPTQVYVTNMSGRLESHLRDLEAENLFKEALNKVEDKEGLLRKLAEGLGAQKELVIGKDLSLEEKVRAVCGYTYLKNLTHSAFVEAISSAKIKGETKEENLAFSSHLENDIGLAGTFVACRVYWIFFSSENRAKWLMYLQKEFGLSSSEAEEVIDKIDLLPAAKRKPADTFLTLAERNLTNTELPNHQWKVLQTSREEAFDLDTYVNAIMRKPIPEVLQRLLKLRDFRRACELTPELITELKKVGIKDEFGDGGLGVEEWSNFGAVVKTMTWFREGYETFKKQAIEIVRNISQDK